MYKKTFIYLSLPLITATFPVISLYRNNVHEADILSLFGVVPDILLATYVTFAILALVFKDVKKASIVTSLSALFYFSFGYYQTISLATIFTFLYTIGFPYVDIISLAWIDLFVYTVGFILIIGFLMSHKDILTRYLRGGSVTTLVWVIFLGLFFFNTSLIAMREFELQKVSASQKDFLLETTLSPMPQDKLPDIYYIIVDRYASDQILQDHFGFDNSQFTQFLKDSDFFIADKSLSNYPKTYLSLGSSMNLDYLDQILTNEQKQSSDMTIMYDRLEDNRLYSLLQSNGYTIVQAGSWWNPTRFNKNADININLYSNIEEFKYILVKSSYNDALRGITLRSEKQKYLLSYNSPNSVQNFIHQVKTIENLVPEHSPKMVMFHVLSVHEPYYFNESCENKVPEGGTDEEIYIQQLTCTNRYLTNLVKSIQDNSSRDAIIVIQSDEGPIVESVVERNWLTNSEEDLQKHMRIYHAIYSPYDLPLYDTMTPVNTWRIIANKVFGTGLDPVPDVSYAYEDMKKPYVFTDITNKVKY